MSCKHLLPDFREKSRWNLDSTADGTMFSNQGGKVIGPKPRINLEDREKVLTLSEEGYSR